MVLLALTRYHEATAECLSGMPDIIGANEVSKYIYTLPSKLGFVVWQ